MLEEKLKTIISEIDSNYTDENLIKLNNFLENNQIRFQKYRTDIFERLINTQFNNTGKFEGFEINENHRFGELMKIKMDSKTVYVLTQDIFFD